VDVPELLFRKRAFLCSSEISPRIGESRARKNPAKSAGRRILEDKVTVDTVIKAISR
jgi:hypothetical protein